MEQSGARRFAGWLSAGTGLLWREWHCQDGAGAGGGCVGPGFVQGWYSVGSSSSQGVEADKETHESVSYRIIGWEKMQQGDGKMSSVPK